MMIKQDFPRPLTDSEVTELRVSVNLTRLAKLRQRGIDSRYCFRCGAVGPCEHSMKRVPTRDEIIG